MNKKVEKGNIYHKKNGERGWIFGNYKKLAGTPFYVKGFEVKWSKLKKGAMKARPDSSLGKTISILIEGKIRTTYWVGASKKTVVLSKEGDYFFFQPGISHTWEALAKSFVITLRWPSPKNRK